MRFTLLDDACPPVALIPGTIALNEIESVELQIIRPNYTHVTRTLSFPDAYVADAIQYIVQQEDLTVSGRYRFVLTLIMTANRLLPVLGEFVVLSQQSGNLAPAVCYP